MTFRESYEYVCAITFLTLERSGCNFSKVRNVTLKTHSHGLNTQVSSSYAFCQSSPPKTTICCLA